MSADPERTDAGGAAYAQDHEAGAAYPTPHTDEATPARGGETAGVKSTATTKPAPAADTPPAVDTPPAAPRTVGPHWLANLFPPMWKKYLGPGWDAKLDAIQRRLEEQEGYYGPYNPAKEDIFNAFWACPPEKVKAIFLLISPVWEVDKADGLALSAPPEKAPGLTIRRMIEGLEADTSCGYVHQEGGVPSLVCWAEQGVLLLNKYLTVPLFKKKADRSQSEDHKGVWDTFVADIIDGLVNEKMKRYHASGANSTAPSDTPPTNAKCKESSAVALVIFSPVNRKIWEKLIERTDAASFKKYKDTKDARVVLNEEVLYHPASRTKKPHWKAVNCFSTINNFLRIRNESPVDWNFLKQEDAAMDRWKGFCSERNTKISELQQHSIQEQKARNELAQLEGA